MSKKDYDNLYTLVEGILAAHASMVKINTVAGGVVNPHVIAISMDDVWHALRPQNMARRRMAAVVNDCLSCSALCEEYGMWVLAEVESPRYVMMRLPLGDNLIAQAFSKRDATRDHPGELGLKLLPGEYVYADLITKEVGVDDEA